MSAPAHDKNIIGRRIMLSFIPRGFLGRVLIRLLRWMEPTCLWQHGMVLQDQDAYVTMGFLHKVLTLFLPQACVCHSGQHGSGDVCVL